METLSIKSAYPPVREVLFSAHDGRLITVTLGTYDRSFCATKRFYLYPKAPELVRFFDEMAAEWRGWQGRKVFKSAEDDLRIEATADRMGHIQLRITISNDVPPPDDQWQVSVSIWLEAGGMDFLARRMKKFLNPYSNSSIGE
jgi:hypothetical protein